MCDISLFNKFSYLFVFRKFCFLLFHTNRIGNEMAVIVDIGLGICGEFL